MKSSLFITAIAVASFLASPETSAQTGPPGMVRIKGDRFNIGADTRQIKDLMEKTQFRPLAAETPMHSVKLGDFFIMVTEVTNEQFAPFIEATNGQPPQSWGGAAIGAAGLEYATRTGKARHDAKKAGVAAPEFEPFDRSRWWKRNWKESEWQIPKDQEAFPVVFINYEQVEGYSRWAGLRPMSEQEFQAAGRGSSNRLYAWGDEAQAKNTNSAESRLGGPSRVGSFESGASWVDSKGRIVDARTNRNQTDLKGIYDLSGNVWEWTRSPFIAYKGFKPLLVQFTSRKKKSEVSSDFDADHRTVVSGAFNGPLLTTRLTTRRNTPRDQATDGLGMRCSASAIPGLDIGRSILRQDLPTSRRPENTTYVPNKITAIDRWITSSGSKPVPGYRIIKSYDVVAFMPVEKIPISSTLILKDRSHDAPIEIGAFSTTVPLLEPAIDPGSYMLSWRAAGKFNKDSNPEEEEEEDDSKGKKGKKRSNEKAKKQEQEEPEFPFDPMRDTMLFRNTSGELVGWMIVDAPSEKRLAPGRIALTELDEKAAARARKAPGTILTFKVFAPSKKPNKGFEFSIPLKVAPGAVDNTWRL